MVAESVWVCRLQKSFHEYLDACGQFVSSGVYSTAVQQQRSGGTLRLSPFVEVKTLSHTYIRIHCLELKPRV